MQPVTPALNYNARPVERRPSNCPGRDDRLTRKPGRDDRLTRQSGLPSQVASQTPGTHWATFLVSVGVLRDVILFTFTPPSFEWSSPVLASAHPMALPGFESRTSNMRDEHVTTTPPKHANVLTLERCDWCARPIERRPSNCCYFSTNYNTSSSFGYGDAIFSAIF
ncbi:hypothetical protein CSKR_112196 [Clonorchis sinensis]|uniref:Uncharacterized protein n=1 Tax=Clonorchis sinensis TaxID=79923 RepID=A0A419PP54_CLOSI|nr:hypothetical protein CSKR_112196 [Clonorchis sinensis]